MEYYCNNDNIDDESDEHALLDRWFKSEEWSQITSDADAGCDASLDLMEEVSHQLASLIFHLKNNSSEHRIEYELNFFRGLCDDFGVA